MIASNISAIIPCYNCEDFIEKTVNSLLNQTTKIKEIILVNDNSSDNTVNILNYIKKSNNQIIRVFNLKENKGPSFARNYGVEKASGEYILFMDSDDIALPQLIEKSIKKLNCMNSDIQQNYVLSYTSYFQIDEQDNTIGNIIRGIQVEPEEILGYEFLRNSVITSGALISKRVFNESNKFNEGLSYSEDWDLWLRLANIGGFCYIDEPLIKVRRRKNSLSSKISKMKEGEKIVLKQYSLDYIEKAINNRKLPISANICDFVSLLFRIDYWEEGFKKLSLLEKEQNNYNIHFLLGLYYIKNNQFNMAAKNLDKVIKLKYNHGAALNNLGAIYCMSNKIEKGITYLKRALNIYPNYIDAKYNLDLFTNKSFNNNDSVKFTWRELRENLINYEN